MKLLYYTSIYRQPSTLHIDNPLDDISFDKRILKFDGRRFIIKFRPLSIMYNDSADYCDAWNKSCRTRVKRYNKFDKLVNILDKINYLKMFIDRDLAFLQEIKEK